MCVFFIFLFIYFIYLFIYLFFFFLQKFCIFMRECFHSLLFVLYEFIVVEGVE